jgi:hypothetical protein
MLDTPVQSWGQTRNLTTFHIQTMHLTPIIYVFSTLTKCQNIYFLYLLCTESWEFTLPSTRESQVKVGGCPRVEK